MGRPWGCRKLGIFERGEGSSVAGCWELAVATTRIETYSIAFQQVTENEGNWENFTKNNSQENRKQ